MMDEDTISSVLELVVKRFVRLDERQDESGVFHSSLYLTCDGQDMLTISEECSLKARRDLMEFVLKRAMTDALVAIIKCKECDSVHCMKRDPDVCSVIQVLGT